MDKARTKFIKEKSLKLWAEWQGSSGISVQNFLEKAIALGMDNSHLKDDEYTVHITEFGGNWGFNVERNGDVRISSFCIFQSENDAKQAAQAIIDILDED